MPARRAWLWLAVGAARGVGAAAGVRVGVFRSHCAVETEHEPLAAARGAARGPVLAPRGRRSPLRPPAGGGRCGRRGGGGAGPVRQPRRRPAPKQAAPRPGLRPAAGGRVGGGGRDGEPSGARARPNQEAPPRRDNQPASPLRSHDRLRPCPSSGPYIAGRGAADGLRGRRGQRRGPAGNSAAFPG